MTIKFELVKAGDRLWDVHSERMGNTALRRMGSWPVDVVEIDHVRGVAIVRWNAVNAPKKVGRRYIERLRRSEYKGRARRTGEGSKA